MTFRSNALISIAFLYLLVNLFVTSASAYPSVSRPSVFLSMPQASKGRRATVQPVFPDAPPSCPICAQNYDGISSCAQAAPVLANFTSVLFNPGAFIDVIKCACTDTFQSAFPQCVDCFEKTNQTDVLNSPDLPSVVNGLRQVCAVASSIFGNVSDSNGETTPSNLAASPTPTPSAGSRIITSQSKIPLSLAALGVLLSSAALF